MRILCQQTILIKYCALFVIFEKAAKFEIVVCCKLKVALYWLISGEGILTIRCRYNWCSRGCSSWWWWSGSDYSTCCHGRSSSCCEYNNYSFKRNGISHSYQLDQTISVLRDIGWHFFSIWSNFDKHSVSKQLRP